MISVSRIDFFNAPAALPGIAEVAFDLVDSAAAFPWHVLEDHAHDDTYRARLHSGHHAALLVIDGALSFRCWLATGPLSIDELAYAWEIPDGDVCVYDVVTSQQFRGRGLYPEALRWIRAHAPSLGADGRVWVICASRNTASRRGIEKAHFTLAGRCSALVLRRRALWRGGRVTGVTE